MSINTNAKIRSKVKMDQIEKLRNKGESYEKISSKIGLTPGTTKQYAYARKKGYAKWQDNLEISAIKQGFKSRQDYMNIRFMLRNPDFNNIYRIGKKQRNQRGLYRFKYEL